MEVLLPRPSVGPDELRALIAQGPESLARYGTFLPLGLDLGGVEAGFTPLRPAPRLGASLGLSDLWVKDETTNPTGSFKDRVVELAAARATAMGATVLACTSTGNLARAVAGAAARRGMAAVVLVPDEVDPAVEATLGDLGAVVVAVTGGYDAASRLGAEAAADIDQWAWVNVSLRPWYELGARTIGWEIAEQLGWRLPRRVVVPMASGALARALHESMNHLRELGLVGEALPLLTAVQPEGCAPLAAAFAAGEERVRPVRDPRTRAVSLAMGDPPDGQAVLDLVRATGGVGVAAPEDEIEPAVALVGSTEGLAVEPAGGVVVSALAGLAKQGTVAPDETVVAVFTGAPPPRRLVSAPRRAGTIEPSVSALVGLLPPDLLR